MAGAIPVLAGAPNQEMQVQLDGVEFTLRFVWQDRDENWYLDVSDAAGNPIWMGQRIATGAPLLFQCVNPNRPLGELVAIDSLDEDKDPELDDFGLDQNGEEQRIQLIYLDAAEVAEVLG
jgi:hypothetical protein